MKYILVAPGDVRRATNDQARVKQEVLEGPIGALDIEDEVRTAQTLRVLWTRFGGLLHKGESSAFD